MADTCRKHYVCSYCKKTFTRNSDLTIHIRRHTGEKPYSCTHCEDKFANKKSQIRHLRIHTGGTRYRCPYCKKTFAYKWSRNAHVKRHSGKKPYKCNYCLKEFTWNKELLRHNRTHRGHKDIIKENTNNNKSDEQNKIINSTKCLNKGELPENIESHPGEMLLSGWNCDNSRSLNKDVVPLDNSQDNHSYDYQNYEHHNTIVANDTNSIQGWQDDNITNSNTTGKYTGLKWLDPLQQQTFADINEDTITGTEHINPNVNSRCEYPNLETEHCPQVTQTVKLPPFDEIKRYASSGQ